MLLAVSLSHAITDITISSGSIATAVNGGTVGSAGNCVAASGWRTIPNVGLCVHLTNGGTFSGGTITKSGGTTTRVAVISDTKWGATLNGSSITVNASNVMIEGLQMTGPNTGTMVTFQTGSNWWLEYSYIHDVLTAVSCNGALFGVVHSTGPPPSANLTVNGNILHHFGNSTCNGQGGFHGFYLDSSGLVFTNNIVSGGTGGWGLQKQYAGITDCTPGVISGNTIFNNQGGIVLNDEETKPCHINNWTISNNIIVNNGVSGTGGGSSAFGIDYYHMASAPQTLVTNNMVYGNLPSDYAIHGSSCTGGTAGCPASTPKNDPSGVTQTFINFQTDTNSSPAASYNANNYQLKSGSNAINGGTTTCASGGLSPCSPTTDLAQNAQSVPPSIGAFTFVGSGAPAVQLSPTSLSFGNQNTGSSSASRPITLTNVGTSSLTISGIASSGDYSQTNNCPATLGTSLSCTINVTFTPTAVGTRSGTISVTDNASGSPHTASLTGTGVNPAGTLAPSSLAFGSQTVGVPTAAQIFTLTNPGSSPLTISSISFANPFPVNVQTVSAPATAQNLTSVTVALPTTQTAGNANVVRIGWNDTTTTVTSVTDSRGNVYSVAAATQAGIGLSQATYYAKNILGGSNSITVNFSATATSPDVIAAEYSGVDTASPLDGNASAFGTGTNAATATFHHLGTQGVVIGGGTTTSHFTNAGTGFTSRLINSPFGSILEDATVNAGFNNVSALATTGNWVMQGIAFVGTFASTNPGDFSQTNNCGSSLAVGASCQISVKFSPQASGARSAVLYVVDNAVGSPHHSSVSGTGIGAAPAASLSPSTLTFAPQLVGATSAGQTATLTNTGTATLNISSTAISGDFAKSTTCGTTLAANASCTFSVTFTPTVTGSRTGTLTVNDDASGSPHTVSLSGTGVAPAVSLSPSSVSFPSQTNGTSSGTMAVTLTNTGTSNLLSLALSLTGTNPGDFAFASSSVVSSIQGFPDAGGATGCNTATWCWTHDAGTAGTSTGISALVASPSLSGQSRRFITSWTGFGGERYSTYFGANNLDTASTNYVYDAEFYITDSSHINNLEFDMNQVVANGDTIIYGIQCNLGTSNWNYTTNVAGGAHWNASNLSCLRSQWTINTWHHLVFTYHRNGSGLVTYDSIAFDGVTSNFSGASGQSNFALGWTPIGTQVLNFQMGGDNTASSTTAYLDQLSVTASANTCGSTVATGASCTVYTRFVPTTTGPRSANLHFVDSAANSPQNVALSGTGIASFAAVTLSPTSLDLGSQTTGSTSPAQTVQVTNSGTATLTLSSIAITGANAADFGLTNPCGASLAAGTSCTLSVTFTPSTTGARSASITLTDNASDSPQSVALSGTGVLPAAPQVSFDLTSLTFASQGTGTSSSPQVVTLTNSGSATLNITSITLTGTNSGDYSRTTTCGSTLAASANCTISVTFTPLAAGTRTANLHFIDNASNSPQDVTLSGTGFVPTPAVSLSSSSLTFTSRNVGSASASQPITVTNSGTGTLTISSVSASGDYSQTNNCTSVPVNGTCTINVVFTPTAIGMRNGTLSITDNASGSPHTVSLSGTGLGASGGVSPSSLTFGSQGINTASVAQNVTLTNSGNIAQTIAVSFTGTNAADFSQTNNCAGSLAAGANCNIAVTFTPSTTGARSASLVITSNAINSPQTVTLSGTGVQASLSISPTAFSFGSQPTGTITSAQTTTLTNVGTAAVTFSSITITGSNNTEFAFASGGTCVVGTPLGAGAACTIRALFQPVSIGAKSASIAVADNAPGSPHSIALTGTGTSVIVAFNPTSLSFGNQPVGTTSSPQTSTFTNSGTANEVISSISLGGGGNPGDFSTSNDCPGTLAPSAFCTITVRFIPTTSGNRTATINVVGTINASLPLTGTGTQSGVSFNPTSLLFGNQTIQTTSPSQNIILTNGGAAPLNISSISLLKTSCSATFSDSFSAGTLDGSKWTATNGAAPGNSSSNTGTFASSHVSLSQGMLQLNLTQAGASNPITSIGGEIVSIPTFGFGTYEWVMREGSTSATPNGAGTARSGQVSSGFNFINNSQTEIDFEIEGQTPTIVELTNWTSTSSNQTSNTTVGTADTAFHDYKFVWASGRIDFYVDDVLVSTHTQNVPVTPAHAIINFWGTNSTQFGGTATINVPRQMYVSSFSYTPPTCGVAADYAQINNCGSSLAAGNSCAISVTFNPAAVGASNAEVQVVSDAPTSPDLAPLSGTGVLPTVVLTPTNFDFGSQAVGTPSGATVFTVTNSGVGAATITSVSVIGTNASDFAVISQDCVGTLTPQATCHISVVFTPSSTGPRNADLNVASNAQGAPQESASMGTGIVPPGGSSFVVGGSLVVGGNGEIGVQ